VIVFRLKTQDKATAIAFARKNNYGDQASKPLRRVVDRRAQSHPPPHRGLSRNSSPRLKTAASVSGGARLMSAKSRLKFASNDRLLSRRDWMVPFEERPRAIIACLRLLVITSGNSKRC
jgi:hypothetical protein